MKKEEEKNKKCPTWTRDMLNAEIEKNCLRKEAANIYARNVQYYNSTKPTVFVVGDNAIDVLPFEVYRYSNKSYEAPKMTLTPMTELQIFNRLKTCAKLD